MTTEIEMKGGHEVTMEDVLSIVKGLSEIAFKSGIAVNEGGKICVRDVNELHNRISFLETHIQELHGTLERIMMNLNVLNRGDSEVVDGESE